MLVVLLVMYRATKPLTSVPPDVNTMSAVSEEKGSEGNCKCWEMGDIQLWYNSEGRLALWSHSCDTNTGMGMIPVLMLD